MLIQYQNILNLFKQLFSYLVFKFNLAIPKNLLAYRRFKLYICHAPSFTLLQSTI